MGSAVICGICVKIITYIFKILPKSLQGIPLPLCGIRMTGRAGKTHPRPSLRKLRREGGHDGIERSEFASATGIFIPLYAVRMRDARDAKRRGRDGF